MALRLYAAFCETSTPSSFSLWTNSSMRVTPFSTLCQSLLLFLTRIGETDAGKYGYEHRSMLRKGSLAFMTNYQLYIDEKSPISSRRYQHTALSTKRIVGSTMNITSQRDASTNNIEKEDIDDPIKEAVSVKSDDEFEKRTNRVIQETMDWIRQVIIGLNLCPFAERSYSSSKIFSQVVWGDDPEGAARVVVFEAMKRLELEGTTVIICPDLCPDDFISYLSILSYIEDVIEDKGMTGMIQIAPFHPQFCFEGSEDGDIDNWTNRSPYPIFHILREKEVSKAVAKIGGDASKVWGRNVSLLNHFQDTLGTDDTVKIMKGIQVKGMREILLSHKLDK